MVSVPASSSVHVRFFPQVPLALGVVGFVVSEGEVVVIAVVVCGVVCVVVVVVVVVVLVVVVVVVVVVVAEVVVVWGGAVVTSVVGWTGGLSRGLKVRLYFLA